jgi:hypothetical protein
VDDYDRRCVSGGAETAFHSIRALIAHKLVVIAAPQRHFAARTTTQAHAIEQLHKRAWLATFFVCVVANDEVQAVRVNSNCRLSTAGQLACDSLVVTVACWAASETETMKGGQAVGNEILVLHFILVW